MGFKLSDRSLQRLEGVEDRLIAVVHRAIELTTVDFGVSEGVRSLERQKELFAKGATQTMNSKHLTGRAVDLVAYVDGKVTWQLPVYDNIADAVKQAASELNTPIRWGAAWHIKDITKFPNNMEAAMNEYIDSCRKVGKRPFIDAPHFELSE